MQHNGRVNMKSEQKSVLIIGGNECMECRYKDICKQYNCSAKVFVKEKGNWVRKMGCPDLMILFTSTVSHKMVNCALAEAKKANIKVERVHSSSASALKNVMTQFAG